MAITKVDKSGKPVALSARQQATNAAQAKSSKSSSGVPAYNAATGKTTGKSSAEYDAYLKSLNKKGSKNYIPTPDDPGFENMDAVNNAKITGNSLDPKIDTSQPSPSNVNATPFTQPQNSVPGYAATPQPALGGAIATPAQAVDLASKYKGGLATLKSSGQTPSTNGGQAMSAIQGVLPPAAPDMSSVDQLLEEDKGWQEIQQMRKDYFDPKTQKTSLMDTYNKLYKQSGLDQLDEEIIDAKTVIEGTEDDIRNEVQQAGGFGTDSQIQALALARNKVLLKNYNNLVAIRESKENHLNTMMSLAEKDRAYAHQKFDKMMNFDMQVLNYRDKFVNNTRDQLNKLAATVGYDGLYQAYSKDPRQMAFAEQILGLPQGGLASAATQASSERSFEMQDKILDRKIKQAQLNKLTAPPEPSAPKVTSINGVDSVWDGSKFVPAPTSVGTGNQLQTSQAQSNIELIDNLSTDPNIRSVVGPNRLARFVGRGFDSATGGRQNYIAGVEQLRSQLTLQNLSNAKKSGATFGALSDSELSILNSSASKLGTWAIKDKAGNIKGYNVSEKEFKRELDKINNFAKLDFVLKGGDPASVGVVIQPNGEYTVRNSDGTYTEL